MSKQRQLINDLAEVLDYLISYPRHSHPGRPAVSFEHKSPAMYQRAVELLRKARVQYVVVTADPVMATNWASFRQLPGHAWVMVDTRVGHGARGLVDYGQELVLIDGWHTGDAALQVELALTLAGFRAPGFPGPAARTRDELRDEWMRTKAGTPFPPELRRDADQLDEQVYVDRDLSRWRDELNEQLLENQRKIVELANHQGPEIVAAVIKAVSSGLGGRVGLGYVAGHRAGTCTRPPDGWLCKRDEGHAGPCAAFPVEPDEGPERPEDGAQ